MPLRPGAYYFQPESSGAHEASTEIDRQMLLGLLKGLAPGSGALEDMPSPPASGLPDYFGPQDLTPKQSREPGFMLRRVGEYLTQPQGQRLMQDMARPRAESAQPEDVTRRESQNRDFGKRNIPYAVNGPWRTELSPAEESQFQQWVRSYKVPMEDDGPYTGYDMRGFWQAWKAGDPRAHMKVNSVDKRLHFTDYWKTPYHESFNKESKYSRPDNPIHWDYSKGGEDNPTLIGPDGQVLLPPMKRGPQR